MSLEIKTFAVEEYHRGEWQPLMSKDKDGKKAPKTVRISEEHAELLTDHALAQISEKRMTTLFRYVEKKQPKKEVKKPSGKMSRQEMMTFFKENEISFTLKDKNHEMLKRIEEFKAKK